MAFHFFGFCNLEGKNLVEEEKRTKLDIFFETLRGAGTWQSKNEVALLEK